MKLFGYLSEYSLAEIFNFIYEGNRTGLLTLSTDYKSSLTPVATQYLWFDRGRITTVTYGLDGIELLTKIEQRRLISFAEVASVRPILDRLSQPLGLYLKSQDLLDAAQIKFLFNSQTISPACKLFEIKHRQFNFDPERLPLNAELTGINISARELGLLGMRLLRDWSGLSSKLPDPNYAIQRRHEQPNFELNRHELQLWKLADGRTPLTKLAVKMALSIEIVRQISFRLTVFGALQEIPLDPSEPVDFKIIVPALDPDSKQVPVSTEFLANLKKFLKKLV